MGWGVGRLIQEVGFPKGVGNILPGKGDRGEALCRTRMCDSSALRAVFQPAYALWKPQLLTWHMFPWNLVAMLPVSSWMTRILPWRCAAFVTYASTMRGKYVIAPSESMCIASGSTSLVRAWWRRCDKYGSVIRLTNRWIMARSLVRSGGKRWLTLCRMPFAMGPNSSQEADTGRTRAASTLSRLCWDIVPRICAWYAKKHSAQVCLS